MRPLCLLFAATISAACSPGSDETTLSAWTSGSRLRAELLDGGSGAVVRTGWIDTTTSERCRFMLADDGMTRCLPLAATPSFRDAGCSDPVFVVPDCGKPVSYVSVVNEGATTCDGASATVYSLGAPEPVAQLFQQDPQGDCKSVAVASGTMVQPPTKIPASMFVAASKQRASTNDGRLAVDLLVADDGSREIVALADDAEGFVCEHCVLHGCVVNLGDYEHRCAPSLAVAQAGAYYADASCSAPTNIVEVDSEGSQCVAESGYAIVGRDLAPGSCGAPSIAFDIRSIGDRIDTVFDMSTSGTCEPALPMGSFHALGAAVPPDQFAKVPTIDIGSGRLRATAFVDGNGDRLIDVADEFPSFRDTQDGERCEAMSFAGGDACVPSSVAAGTPYFTDAACSSLVASISPSACAGPPPSTVVMKAPNGGCGSVNAAYAVGASVTPMTVYVLDGAACVPYPGAAPTDLFALESVDPFSLWAALTTRVE